MFALVSVTAPTIGNGLKLAALALGAVSHRYAIKIIRVEMIFERIIVFILCGDPPLEGPVEFVG